MLDAFTDFLKALGLPWEMLTIGTLWGIFIVFWGAVIGLILWLYLRAGQRRRISQNRPSGQRNSGRASAG